MSTPPITRHGVLPRPGFEPLHLRCARCGHEWTGYMAVQCSFTLAIASLKALSKAGCPACPAGGKSVLIVNTP